MRGTGFLTKEERLVFLTLSLCLVGGGLFQFVNSLFELPEEIALPDVKDSSSGTDAATDVAAASITYHDTDGAAASGGGAPGPTSSSAGTLRPSTKLDLNKATAAELDALPGIGPALAGRIIEQRKIAGNFHSVEDLLDVRGIGEKTLAKFRQWVYVSSAR
ncbi:MAG: helix-hairpin-helix domain-containing protein [Candidatus Eisenbacteria bacterium]|nr:helix-hairpin-helix domain-containing protein [Candidatus Eisenbacteria bacterium]